MAKPCMQCASCQCSPSTCFASSVSHLNAGKEIDAYVTQHALHPQANVPKVHQSNLLGCLQALVDSPRHSLVMHSPNDAMHSAVSDNTCCADMLLAMQAFMYNLYVARKSMSYFASPSGDDPSDSLQGQPRYCMIVISLQ